jgi:amidohydrolase
MDALPIEEATGLPFSSVHPGVSHSCGHDCHTSMLLGCAMVLQQMKDDWNGKIKLIFQPSEENVLSSGAKKMIADGVLENPPVDAIFGQHVWPQYAAGTVAVRNGAMMASSDRFEITVKGRKSHGSQPENGVDAIVAAAHLITALQSIVSRNVPPQDAAVLTIGTIHGGDRYNVIAGEVKLEGTCRTLNPEVRNAMPERIERVIHGTAQALGASAELVYHRGYSPTVNDPRLFELGSRVMKERLGEENVFIPQNSGMGGEDFSFYCEKVPGLFFWLGCRDPKVAFQDTYPIHNGGLLPQESALKVGMEIMAASALEFLK